MSAWKLRREVRRGLREEEDSERKTRTLDDAEVCDDEVSKVKLFVGTELLAKIDHFVDPLKSLIVLFLLLEDLGLEFCDL